MSVSPVTAPPREQGVVLWFHEARGFGFITSGADGAPVFVSHRDIPGERFRSLLAGDTVSFSRTIDQHGPIAQDVVRCVEEQSPAGHVRIVL